MATYKKASKKAKTEVEKMQGIEGESTTAEVFNTLDETASKSELWVMKNQKKIFIVLGLIVVGILAYLAYNKFIKEPNEKEATDELAFPKKYYDKALKSTVEVDSLFKLGLNGADGKYGFVDIADKYSGTTAGNLANGYAGISYLKMKDYKNAIAHLDDFSADDELIAPTMVGAIGDAFADIEQLDDALSYYEKAGTMRDNNFTSPLFLFKAGVIALELKEYGKAEKLFKQIKEEYPTSNQAQNIDAYISRAKYAQE